MRNLLARTNHSQPELFLGGSAQSLLLEALVLLIRWKDKAICKPMPYLKTLKKLNFRRILDLQKGCKESKDGSHLMTS